MRKIFLLATALTAAIIFTGCGNGNEVDHPLFKKGESAQKAGNGAEAAAAYKELIQKREDCTYSHLKLAMVYDELLNDPLMAAMHYRIYLEKNPQDPDAANIRAWLERAERRYYDSVKHKYEPITVGSSAADQTRIEELEAENEKLLAYKARYENIRAQHKNCPKPGTKAKK